MSPERFEYLYPLGSPRCFLSFFFFFNDTATTEIYTLSLHDALPICGDVPVTVAKASTRDVPVEVQVIGNVEAYSTITVKALVGGQLTNVYFKEGDFVRKGEKLFDIDRRPLEAAYNQAVANIARD